MTLVVDASVGLKWVLQEADSHLAQALASDGEELLVPDFWLNEASNVCWVQVRKGIWTWDQAKRGFQLLQNQIPPTPTGELNLHEAALDIGLAANHSVYDTLYVSFAIAVGARGVVVADATFVKAIERHPDATVAAMMIPLAQWAQERRLSAPN